MINFYLNQDNAYGWNFQTRVAHCISHTTHMYHCSVFPIPALDFNLQNLSLIPSIGKNQALPITEIESSD